MVRKFYLETDDYSANLSGSFWLFKYPYAGRIGVLQNARSMASLAQT